MIAVCPNCHKEGIRAIHIGLPVWLCPDERSCGTMWGFWSSVVEFFSLNDMFVVYDHRKVAYPVALYYWLTRDPEDN